MLILWEQILKRATATKTIPLSDDFLFRQVADATNATPGHSNGCLTYVCKEQGMAFTGDTLLIRGCGRTDFQEGSPTTLFESVHSNIFSLPVEFKLYSV
ncbi:Hypothetical predicted protein [Cloeon dipterum]|uniref:Metallo-beta-lactamase domain-containing protein n=1 Tax=Cloeon dipterum TaxID=197152 RepID=A0A8S1DH19_9INSE|nr:Hypothetical predicted protein [Cloeon dipterum]